MELDPWTQSLVNAMTSVWAPIAGFIPRLFGALIVVLLGFVVAKLLDTLLSKLLAKIGLDRLMAGTGLLWGSMASRRANSLRSNSG